MTFKEFIALHEMGYWRADGGAVAVPGLNGRPVLVDTLDMRFEDYSFPGGGYGTNWYAGLPGGGVLSNHGAAWENRFFPSAAEFRQYRADLDGTSKRPNLWVQVPERPVATNPDLDGRPHPWWDYAEGLDEGGNEVLKPGLWRLARLRQTG
jgi:hypothetical protein